MTGKPTFRYIMYGICAVAFYGFNLTAYGKENLRIHVWEGYAPKAQVELFKKEVKKKLGEEIQVTVTHADESQEFFDRLRRNEADVIALPHNLVQAGQFQFLKRNIVMELDLKQIPNYKNVQSGIQELEFVKKAGKVYGIPIAHGPYGLAVNKSIVKENITSWNALWDKKYAKNFSVSKDQYEANVYLSLLVQGIEPKDFENLKVTGTKKTQDLLNQLAANAKTKWVAVDSADKLKGLALATSWGDSMNELNKQGEKWEIVDPKEGTTGWLDYILISSSLKGKKKKIAHMWLNHILSKEFQANHIVKNIGNDPVTSNLKDVLSPENIKRHHLDQPNYFKENRTLWPTLEARVLNAYKVMWNRALKNSGSAH